MRQDSNKKKHREDELKKFWEKATKADNMLLWVATHSAETPRTEGDDQQRMSKEGNQEK